MTTCLSDLMVPEILDVYTRLTAKCDEPPNDLTRPFDLYFHMIGWCEDHADGPKVDYTAEMNRAKAQGIPWPEPRYDIDPNDPDWGMYAVCTR